MERGMPCWLLGRAWLILILLAILSSWVCSRYESIKKAVEASTRGHSIMTDQYSSIIIWESSLFQTWWKSRPRGWLLFMSATDHLKVNHVHDEVNTPQFWREPAKPFPVVSPWIDVFTGHWKDWLASWFSWTSSLVITNNNMVGMCRERLAKLIKRAYSLTLTTASKMDEWWYTMTKVEGDSVRLSIAQIAHIKI